MNNRRDIQMGKGWDFKAENGMRTGTAHTQDVKKTMKMYYLTKYVSVHTYIHRHTPFHIKEFN